MTCKFYWNHIEKAVQLGRLTLCLHSDWYLDRPRIYKDETETWIFCIGWVSIGWDIAR